jgi:hypothetical protein
MTTNDEVLDLTNNPAIDTVLGVDHRIAGSVRRLLAELPNVIAYGKTDRVQGIYRELKELGYKGPTTSVVDPAGQTPVGRSSGKPDVTAPVVDNTTPPKGVTAT